MGADDRYTRIGEFSSGGIGPNEILRMPNATLAVANGGIRTHPESGHEKLNLGTMRANLSIFTPEGTLLDQAIVNLDIHHNSLRHIAVQADGLIACAYQWQGDPFDSPPLLSLYQGNGHLNDADMDETLLRQLNGYIGSVARGPHCFVASCARGRRVFTLDVKGQTFAPRTAQDVCSVAQCGQNETLVTTGNGHVYKLGSFDLKLQQQHIIAFDSHLIATSGDRKNDRTWPVSPKIIVRLSPVPDHHLKAISGPMKHS